MHFASKAGRLNRRRTRWPRGPGSCIGRRAKCPSRESNPGFEPNGDASRAERLAEFLETPGDPRAAMLARTLIIELVAADVVPVALDQRLLARGAIGGAAGL